MTKTTAKIAARDGQLSDFLPQQNNANKHTERGLSALETSVQLDGWIGAITVAANGETFDGSARIEKGVATDLTDAIIVETDGRRPIVHIRTDIPTAADERAIRLGIAANRVAQLDLDWDAGLLKSYSDSDPDLLLGLFSNSELKDLFLGLPKPDLEEAGKGGDEYNAKPNFDGPTRAHTGDIYSIGPHLLMCGDATDRSAIDRLTGGQTCALLLTDPPYNLGMDYNIDGWADSLEHREYQEWTQEWHALWSAYSDLQIVTPGLANLNMWHKLFRPVWTAPWLITNGMSHGIISHFLSWEPLLFLASGPQKFPRRRGQDNFNYPISEQRMADGATLTGLHPCPKPLALWTDLIDNYSQAGDTIGDCFGGTGTTLIAANRTGRRAVIMEKSPAYCDVILSRALAEGIGPIERIAGANPPLPNLVPDIQE